MTATENCNAGVQAVYLIDDDDAVRTAMSRLFESANLVHQVFASGTEFLDIYTAELPGCIVLDIRMPIMSGLELQRELNRLGSVLPIIFMTGHGDLPMAVRAMRLGAFNFLRKPIDDKELLDSIQQGFVIEAAARTVWQVREYSASLIAMLTDREKQIFERITDGHANKAIASELDISMRTVEVHRSHVMQKLDVNNMAELIRLRLEAETALQLPGALDDNDD